MGGVSERTKREDRRDLKCPSREADFLALERWKASWSSGKRHSSRSAVGTKASVGPSACSGILHCKQTRRRQRMSGGCQGGERRRHARQSACTQRTTTSSYAPEDTSFAWSSNSCRRSSLRTAGAILGGGAIGGHHGWANPRKREEPALGPVVRTSATRRASPSPQGGGRDAKEKEGDRGLRPARSKSSGLVARTSKRCCCRSR